MKKGFTFLELIIVAAILGIMAAIIVPVFQSFTTEAKESAAKSNLRIMRSTIETYAFQNKVAPGYSDNNPSNTPKSEVFLEQLTTFKATEATPKAGMWEFPENPFNNKDTVLIIDDGQQFPDDPVQTDVYGWVYQPFTKTIKVNWQGSDKYGIAYFDY